jgi:hypothetical protein
MTDPGIWQFQLGDVLFGDDTQIINTRFSMTEPAVTTADQVMPGEDGVMMGRDYLQGRTLSWDLMVDRETAADARALWQSLESAWDAADTRSTPGAVVPVRIQPPGRGVVLAYGRPRKIAPADMQFMRNGGVPITADFATVDRFFYDDVEQEVSFGIRPTIGSGGGITWPVTWPITWASADTANSDVAVNAGNARTWPVITFTGPVVNPTIVLGDNLHTLKLVATIAENETVTIDTRPWVRSVTRDDGGSLAGTMRGSRLSDLVLMPGSTLISMQGIDLSGTASGQLRWRSAYTTP